MFRAVLVAFTSSLLVSSSDDRIDESLLRGTWVMGNYECGSDMEIIYRDGMLGNPIPKTHELYKFTDFFAFLKVISAERKGDEVSIQVKSMHNYDDPVYTTIFRIEKNKYVAIRSFTDQRIEGPRVSLSDLDWTRCDD